MKAHLTADNEKLIATLEEGACLIADSSLGMVEQLIAANVTADELTVTDWNVDIDHAPTSGQIIAIKYALMKHFKQD